MKIDFNIMNASSVRIVITDKNWDEDNYVVGLKRIEILSPDSKYQNGVFSTLIEESKSKDSHNCGVLISTTDFDFNSFHSIDSKTIIQTYPFDEDQWFQIELTKGMALIHAIRIKNNQLKAFKVLATDDKRKPLDSWIKLIEVKEKSANLHKKLAIYNLDCPSPPVNVIRIIQISPSWDNNKRLVLYHFDIFGYYI